MYHNFASDLSGHQLTVPFVYNIDQNSIYINIYIYIYISSHTGLVIKYRLD